MQSCDKCKTDLKGKSVECSFGNKKFVLCKKCSNYVVKWIKRKDTPFGTVGNVF